MDLEGSFNEKNGKREEMSVDDLVRQLHQRGTKVKILKDDEDGNNELRQSQVLNQQKPNPIDDTVTPSKKVDQSDKENG